MIPPCLRHDIFLVEQVLLYGREIGVGSSTNYDNITLEELGRPLTLKQLVVDLNLYNSRTWQEITRFWNLLRNTLFSLLTHQTEIQQIRDRTSFIL